MISWTFKAFAARYRLKLLVDYYPERAPPFVAHFSGVETKRSRDDMALESTWGDGVTAEDAVEDYEQQLRGKLLIFHAYQDDRREIVYARSPIVWQKEFVGLSEDVPARKLTASVLTATYSRPISLRDDLV